jgi:RNA polymerase sigma-70 factor (ECF subfamily)
MVHRIAINSALMIYRKHRRRGEVTVMGDSKESDFMLMNITDPRPSPLDVLRTKQEYEVLRHAIDSLPMSLKEGLQVRCNDDLSLRELAARLHLSLPATKTRLLRAKRYVIARAGAHLIPGHSRK